MYFVAPLVLRCTVLGILIAGLLGVDFAAGLFFPSNGPEILGAVLLGSCIGQINLIASWAALAQGNVVVRLPWALLLGAMMWYALILGNRMRLSSFSLDESILCGVFLLAGIVIAQIPLWIAGKVFRWQLISPDAPAGPTTQGRLQFNLQQMLLGTTLFSIALAPLRTILPLDVRGRADFAGGLLGVFAVVTICNLLVTMPCIWGAMRPRRNSYPWALDGCSTAACSRRLNLARYARFSAGQVAEIRAPRFSFASSTSRNARRSSARSWFFGRWASNWSEDLRPAAPVHRRGRWGL